MANRPGHDLRSRRNAEFGHHVFDMLLDGTARQRHAPRDLGITQSLTYPGNHLALAVGQTSKALLATLAVGPSGHRGCSRAGELARLLVSQLTCQRVENCPGIGGMLGSFAAPTDSPE